MNDQRLLALPPSTADRGRRTFLAGLGSGLILGRLGLRSSTHRAFAQEASEAADPAVRIRGQQRSEPVLSASVGHRRIETNGIEMHVAEAGAGPLVVLLHGFPELWYSWRHQLPVLADAGYHAVAPDLRGYGETDAPEAIETYSMRNLTADVIGVLDALGAERAVLVGHDWGGGIATACAELFPRRVAALVVMGAYARRAPTPPTQMLQQFAQGKFNFALAFQQPGAAEAELDADPRRSMRLFLYALSGEAPPDLVTYLFTGKPADAGVLDGMPEPAALPAGLTEADLDEYARAFERSGFRGGLNWYRNMDRNWEELPQVGVVGMDQAALFMAGTRDSQIRFGSFEPTEAAASKLRKIVLLPRCGHWTQQERPDDVNAELIAFLRREIGH